MRRVISDDGRSVTLDLHGERLADAERLVRRTIQVAADRGRTSVRVIHGSSTSDGRARNQTIKHLVEDLLESGELGSTTSHFATGDATIIGLRTGVPTDTRRIGLGDVR